MSHNILRKLSVGAALSMFFAWQANATVEYDFDYSGGGEVAHGSLFGNDNPDGSITVTSGYFEGTAGNILGLYTILPNPNAPGTALSPSGLFIYNNVVYPTLDPHYDNWGLLFGAGGVELNLWGNSPGNYSLYLGAGGGYPVTFDGPAAFSLAPAPEPGSFVIIGVGLLAVIYLGRLYHQTTLAT